jgi:hypothetical protein
VGRRGGQAAGDRAAAGDGKPRAHEEALISGLGGGCGQRLAAPAILVDWPVNVGRRTR